VPIEPELGGLQIVDPSLVGVCRRERGEQTCGVPVREDDLQLDAVDPAGRADDRRQIPPERLLAGFVGVAG
jgi:hypothetical protein